MRFRLGNRAILKVVGFDILLQILVQRGLLI